MAQHEAEQAFVKKRVRAARTLVDLKIFSRANSSAVWKSQASLHLVLRNVLAATAVLFLSTSSWAQNVISNSVPQKRTKSEEQAQIRARYGVAIRSGGEADSGPGLTYSGVSPNDIALSAWAWFLFGDHLGLT
jgi:hypothetical protein